MSVLTKCGNCGEELRFMDDEVACVWCGFEMPLKAQTEPGDEVPCSAGSVAPAVDDEMLVRAMKKAVEVGICPKHAVDGETYLKH